ncbi:MAG: S8/S53 family peptidase, partial [Acidimicrobiales bacterium]
MRSTRRTTAAVVKRGTKAMHWRSAGLVTGALAIATPLVLTQMSTATTAGVEVSPAASHSAHIPNDHPRPWSCPPQNGDPNAPNDGAGISPAGTFPWPAPVANSDPEKYATYLHTTPVNGFPERPANWTNGGGQQKLTSARTTNAQVAENPQDLCGVEGNSVDTAWQTTTGRPDVFIAITDSGIEWCDPPIVNKVHLNIGALPYPENATGLTKPQLEAAPYDESFADNDPYDHDNSGVINVAQYAKYPRVKQLTAETISQGYFCGSYITAEDLIRTFGSPTIDTGRADPPPNPYYYPTAGSGSTATETPTYPGQSPAGFTEAIAGWNFLDNSNDPYDDVQYGHGTGEAEDATAAADGSGEVGTCPDCMVMPIRVGESFIAEANDFARGVLFAVDSGASVLQEALGTLDVTTTAAQAIAYANAHGVPVISSAADEEAEHHNEPGNLPGTIVVNSVTDSPTAAGVNLYNPPGYLFLNGCTNYGANIGVSVESNSCSSEATGKTGGITGLIEAEAKNMVQDRTLTPYPGLTTVSRTPVGLSSTEVRELIEMSADDVDFQTPVVPNASDATTTLAEPPDNYGIVSPVPTTRYPTQPGYDMYTGYGRLDANTILSWLHAGKIPPEASFGEMQWFQTYNPTSQSVSVPLSAAAVRTPGTYHWELQYGIGTQPEPAAWTNITGGSGQGGMNGTPTSTTVTLPPADLKIIAAQLPLTDN